MPNVTLAFRTLVRTPVVTAVAVLSLALGIGANTAIFSVLEQLFRQPLPVPQPDQLVNLRAPGPIQGAVSCGFAGSCDGAFSYPMFQDLERGQTMLTGLAAHVHFDANVATGGQTISTDGEEVSGSYFPTLRLRPALGRLLTTSDDQPIGADYVAVLSYGYWQDRLGRDSSVLGKPIVINGRTMRIVGVAPRGFTGTTPGTRPSVFVPMAMRGVMSPNWHGFTNRRSYWAYLFGRLKPGVTLAQAQAALNAVYHPIIVDVEAPLQRNWSRAVLGQFEAKRVILEHGARGQSVVLAGTKAPLEFLFAVAAIVLLIACVNIANLLLARGANRTMEMAVRRSLGAARWQIVAQLLTESLLLAMMGGVLSILLAKWTLASIASMLPASSAWVLSPRLNLSAIRLTAGVSIGTGLLFGLFPALQGARPELVRAFGDSAGRLSGTRASTRLRTLLVTAQIALSMTLLICAGLFIKSLRNVTRTNLGFRTGHVATFGLSPVRNGYSAAQSAALFGRADQELRGIPGVSGATEARVPTLTGGQWWNDVTVEGYTPGAGGGIPGSAYNEVGADYFHVMGVPILAGRDFTSADMAGAPKVAVVNQAFAREFGLGSDPVGRFMSIASPALDIRIVGLARDAKYWGPKVDVPPMYFIPWRQDTTLGELHFYVRTSVDPAPVLQAVPAAMARLDPNLPVDGLTTLRALERDKIFLDRMTETVCAAFAALATLLAAVGLYGVLAFSVSRRTRELGIRMALGADGRRIRRMILRQVGLMILVGCLLGIGAGAAIGRAAQALLYQLSGWDPEVIGVAAAVLSIVALGAGYLPARRASSVDPVNALRYE